MFDIKSNHKICKFREHATQTIGAADQPSANGVNTAEESANGLYSRNSRGLLIVEVTDVNTTGTLTLLFKDKSLRENAFATMITLDAISAAGLYYLAIKDYKQYVKLAATVANASVVWGSSFITFDALRRPVKQTDATLLTATIAAGR